MKVGKAIYNILSQSTDVQSNFPFNTTDYSPTGTELVTNGDFSATGSELITNGDFSATGSEMNVLTSSGSAWSDHYRLEPYTNTVSYLGSNVTELTYVDNPELGYQYFTSAYNLNTATLTIGKSYKVEVTCKVNSGTFSIRTGSDIGAYYTTGFDNTDYETITIYAYCSGTTHNWIKFDDFGTGQILLVNNISVKELGVDWSDAGTPSYIASAAYNENGLTITSVNGDGNNNRVQQAAVTQDDKSYKVTYTIHSVDLTGTNVFQYYNGEDYVTFSEQDAGTHTFYYTRQGVNNNFFLRISTNDGSTTDYVTISSISVEELGEGWTLEDGWSVGENKAIATAGDSGKIKQTINLSGKYAKVIFTLSNYGGSGNCKVDFGSTTSDNISSNGTHIVYGIYDINDFELYKNSGFSGDVTNISVEEMVLNKIFPELAPPDIDAPYVVYSVVSNSPSETKNTNGDIDTANIEVYGFQDTYNKAVDLGVSVRAALDRKTGTYNTIEIQSTNYVNEQMDVNEARKLWAAIQDYTIRIKNI
jgi:hypothetical protein